MALALVGYGHQRSWMAVQRYPKDRQRVDQKVLSFAASHFQSFGIG